MASSPKQRGAKPIIRPQLFEASEAVRLVLKLESYIDGHGERPFAALSAGPSMLPTLASATRPSDGKKGNCREGQDATV